MNNDVELIKRIVQNHQKIYFKSTNVRMNANLLVSSEGALYVILPYDYPAAAHPLFEHTPVLNNNFEY